MTSEKTDERTAALAAALAEELSAGRTELTAKSFHDDDAPPPVILFDPTGEAIAQPVLQQLDAYWRALGGRSGAPAPLAAFDPLEVTGCLPYVMMLDVLDGGADYRYRVYGREVSGRFGRDMTGRTLSEMPVKPRIIAFFQAVYRASLARRESILTEHAPPPSVSVTSWRRLILPLANADGEVIRFAVGNIPGEWRSPA
ncbi:MAG: PAS domain-containing protein [Leptolyngbya sp. SIO1D8]|nr:PAS domain-containing protein [Leptolyngbya sp. SIO1D8]